ncbi:glycosyltransferase [Anaeromyxobacter dehalogenans]|uniref:Glycosyl transferase, group 1 n=1 Tax=Anaeromyxobacter dehalogenans (strain 2CP-C) TaxID=290397 RepID=Q2IL79_ANADE|nr:glycosyltransferase [Anaeromyxobacter dehalogenans]ABC82409.1 glycosyl transferase, group 1 [Anaeromyxobacter dehalogenans 2CP-C]
MPGPRRILIFQNRFRIGGQERQTVLNVRSMDRARFDPVVAVLHLDGDHLQDLEDAGVRPVVFDVGGRMIRPNTAWQLARIVRFVRAERIAVIHAQDVYTNVLGTLAARLARVPVIVTRVDLGHHLEGYRRPLLQAASRVADRVLVNALCIRDLAVREGVEADRVAVVRNGVDLEALDREARRAPEHPVPEPGAVVCIANMHHPVKGQSDLLMAMREVLRTRPDARLVLVGEGLRRPLLERLARRLGISDRCHFLGHRLDAPALLARAAAGVSASHAEGISNAILESMAMRLPVVATRVGGTPEVVREGQNGFLVPPGAPAALARRLLDLLRDPALRRRMGERGRRIVEEEFGLAQMRLSYDALYHDLTEDPSPRIVAGLG